MIVSGIGAGTGHIKHMFPVCILVAMFLFTCAAVVNGLTFYANSSTLDDMYTGLVKIKTAEGGDWLSFRSGKAVEAIFLIFVSK